ncbi:9059_t:CDS:1, partial [Funneliformis caledonium]
INLQNSDHNDDVIQPNLVSSSQDLDGDVLLNKYSLPNLASSLQELDDNISLDEDSLSNSVNSLQDLDDDILSDEDSFTSDRIIFATKPNNVRKKRRKYNQFCMTSNYTIIIPDKEYEQQVDSSSNDKEFWSVNEESSLDELLLNDNKSFAIPEYVEELDTENTSTNINMNDFWILLWIFKYQEKFRLPDIAVDSLIKFFRVVLSDTNKK